MKTQKTLKIEAILQGQRDRTSISGRITGAIFCEWQERSPKLINLGLGAIGEV